MERAVIGRVLSAKVKIDIGVLEITRAKDLYTIRTMYNWLFSIPRMHTWEAGSERRDNGFWEKSVVLEI